VALRPVLSDGLPLSGSYNFERELLDGYKIGQNQKFFNAVTSLP
jgi:hypothetical protein